MVNSTSGSDEEKKPELSVKLRCIDAITDLRFYSNLDRYKKNIFSYALSLDGLIDFPIGHTILIEKSDTYNFPDGEYKVIKLHSDALVFPGKNNSKNALNIKTACVRRYDLMYVNTVNNEDETSQKNNKVS